MFTRTWVAFSFALAVCLLQISPSYSKRHARKERIDNDLFLDNVVVVDLKDDGLENIETSGLPDNEQGTETTEDDMEGCSPAARRNTDKYVDKVLDEVRPKLPEPAFLPERVGRFRLFNGTLYNLVSMERTGPALVRCSDNTFSFLVPIGLRNVTGRYFWETDTGVPVFRGFIDMRIGHIDADVFYTRVRNQKDSEPKARVDKLTITRLHGVKVKFDGLGPFNVIASRFTNLIIRFFTRGVSRALEGPIRHAINKELQNVKKYEMYYY